MSLFPMPQLDSPIISIFTVQKMTLDTACSSSLQAVQLGVKSLRPGEVDLAVADATNSNSSPESFFTSLIVDAVSPDGRCRWLRQG